MNQYILKILRQENSNSKPYFESFLYDGNPNDTISLALETINKKVPLLNIEGKESKPISWNCSCKQGVCGACGMVINGEPTLACKYFLSLSKSNTITIEPLSKFDIIRDLSVNKEILHDIFIKDEIYPKTEANIIDKDYNLLYESAKCLKCGLCIEVCPNTSIKHKYPGFVYANECFIEASQTNDDEHKNMIFKSFDNNVAAYCCKSLSCEKVCPAHIEVKKILTKMNGGKK